MTLLYHVFSDELPNPKHTEYRYNLEELNNKIVATNLKNYFIIGEHVRNFNLIEVVGHPDDIVKLQIEHLEDKIKALKFDLEGLEAGKVRPEKIIGRGFNTKSMKGIAAQHLQDSIASNQSKLDAMLEAADQLGISPNEALKCKVLRVDAWSDGEGGWTWNQWFDTGVHIIDPLRLNNRELLRELRRAGVDVPKGTCAVEDDQHNLVIVEVNGRRPLYAVEYGPVYL
jgi:hypothetical protein